MFQVCSYHSHRWFTKLSSFSWYSQFIYLPKDPVLIHTPSLKPVMWPKLCQTINRSGGFSSHHLIYQNTIQATKNIILQASQFWEQLPYVSTSIGCDGDYFENSHGPPWHSQGCVFPWRVFFLQDIARDLDALSLILPWVPTSNTSRGIASQQMLPRTSQFPLMFSSHGF